jgi:hypothetical protein
MNPMYIGWDIHCKFSKVTFAEKRKDGQMRVVKRVRLEHDDQQAMGQWLLPYRFCQSWNLLGVMPNQPTSRFAAISVRPFQ